MKWIKNKVVIAILTAALSAGLISAGVNPKLAEPIVSAVSAIANSLLNQDDAVSKDE